MVSGAAPCQARGWIVLTSIIRWSWQLFLTTRANTAKRRSAFRRHSNLVTLQLNHITMVLHWFGTVPPHNQKSMWKSSRSKVTKPAQVDFCAMVLCFRCHVEHSYRFQAVLFKKYEANLRKCNLKCAQTSIITVSLSITLISYWDSSPHPPSDIHTKKSPWAKDCPS